MVHRSISRLVSITALCIAGVLVLGYYLLFLFSVPDFNFEYHPTSGVITRVEPRFAEVGLQPGDKILAMDNLPLANLAKPGAATIGGLVRDQHIALHIQRGQQEIDIYWPVTNPDAYTYLLRTLQMLPAFIFLSSALFVFLLVRPHNESRLLLLAVFSVGAIWLAARMVSDVNLRWSDGIFRAAIWLMVPPSLHFTWIYPRTLSPIPKPVMRAFYTLFSLLALLDLFHLLAPTTYYWCTVILGVGLPVLILMHLILHKYERRDLRVVLISLCLVFSLAATFTFFGRLFQSQILSALSFTTLIFVPLAYIFTIIRQIINGVEMRANQALVLVSFTALIMVIAFFSSMLFDWLVTSPSVATPLQVILTVLYVILAVTFYPAYHTWAQRRLLGIRIPPKELMDHFTSRITTSLETSRLVQVLCEELSPSLLIRQMIFLRLDEHGKPLPLATCGTEFVLPLTANDIPVLLDMAGRYRPHSSADTPRQPFSQVRLVLKLMVEGQPVGLTLFGRRDPDDFYSSGEIVFLQTMMDQAALALVNIAQAERLHYLYQANIQSTDNERQRLARELHDEVLGPLGAMMINASWKPDPDSFNLAYHAAANRIRAIIEGLRPSVLDHSLGLAIEELTGQMADYAQHNNAQLLNQVTEQDGRYLPDVEMQVYRILQEACNNAVVHGKARQIVISGQLKPNHIDLTIADNGIGFQENGSIDLTTLLRQRHFGLAGIYERAALIGAVVKIVSKPNHGTRISLRWSGLKEQEAGLSGDLSTE